MYTSFVELVTIDITQPTSIHLLSVWSYLNLLRPGCFLWYCNITSIWRSLGFFLRVSSVWARRSTTCLSTPSCFPLCHPIACTLPTYHELALNMLVAFPTLTTVVERPFFLLVADFKVGNSLIVLPWTRCTPQSNLIDNKLDPHEDLDLAWRQLNNESFFIHPLWGMCTKLILPKHTS